MSALHASIGTNFAAFGDRPALLSPIEMHYAYCAMFEVSPRKACPWWTELSKIAEARLPSELVLDREWRHLDTAYKAAACSMLVFQRALREFWGEAFAARERPRYSPKDENRTSPFDVNWVMVARKHQSRLDGHLPYLIADAEKAHRDIVKRATPEQLLKWVRSLLPPAMLTLLGVDEKHGLEDHGVAQAMLLFMFIIGRRHTVRAKSLLGLMQDAAPWSSASDTDAEKRLERSYTDQVLALVKESQDRGEESLLATACLLTLRIDTEAIKKAQKHKFSAEAKSASRSRRRTARVPFGIAAVGDDLGHMAPWLSKLIDGRATRDATMAALFMVQLCGRVAPTMRGSVTGLGQRYMNDLLKWMEHQPTFDEIASESRTMICSFLRRTTLLDAKGDRDTDWPKAYQLPKSLHFSTSPVRPVSEQSELMRGLTNSARSYVNAAVRWADSVAFALCNNPVSDDLDSARKWLSGMRSSDKCPFQEQANRALNALVHPRVIARRRHIAETLDILQWICSNRLGLTPNQTPPTHAPAKVAFTAPSSPSGAQISPT